MVLTQIELFSEDEFSEYSFGGFGGKGKIKAGNEFEFVVTSKELFDILHYPLIQQLALYWLGE